MNAIMHRCGATRFPSKQVQIVGNSIDSRGNFRLDSILKDNLFVANDGNNCFPPPRLTPPTTKRGKLNGRISKKRPPFFVTRLYGYCQFRLLCRPMFITTPRKNEIAARMDTLRNLRTEFLNGRFERTFLRRYALTFPFRKWSWQRWIDFYL